MKKELYELRLEVDRLKRRVAMLEQQVGEGVENPPQFERPVTPATMQDIKAHAGSTGPSVMDRLPPIRRKRAFEGMSEEQLAGTWFSRLGILAIMVAMAFFLKWSFDNQIIGELGRIVIGIIIGLGFLGAGEYFQHKKYQVFGQGFTGGGIAILYFSIYAAFDFYQLMPQPVAFTLMILITAAASLLAIRYDSVAVGIIGIVGGFATPFLLGSGQSSRVVLFTYMTILDAGVLLIAYFKKWPVFNNLTFFFTYAAFVAGLTDARSLDYFSLRFDAVSFSFLTVYFLIYLSIPLIWNVYLKMKFKMLDLVLMLLNAAVYFGLSYNLLRLHIIGFTGFWAVILGMVYMSLGWVVFQRYPDVSRLSLTLLAIAAGFVTIAIPLQFDGYWMTMAWAAESVIVFYLGLKLNAGKIPVAGLVILAVAIVSMVLQPFEMTGKEIWIFLNKGAVACLFLIFSMGATLWIYHRNREVDKAWNKPLMLGLQLALNALIVFFFTMEINAFYDYRLRTLQNPDIEAILNTRNLALSLIWGLHAALLVVLGFWRRMQGIRWFGLGFLGVVILKVFLLDLSNLSTPNRILSFVGLGVILLAVSWIYHRFRHQLSRGEDIEKIEKIEKK